MTAVGGLPGHLEKQSHSHDLRCPHSRQELQLPILQRRKLRPGEEACLPRLEVGSWFNAKASQLSSSSPWLPGPFCPEAVG